jgi:prolipoprotein diacylglyceryltransferase
MFGLYLLLNGTERYLIEMMRVNIRYKYQLTQAEIIALALIGIGVLLIIFAKKINPKPEINS